MSATAMATQVVVRVVDRRAQRTSGFDATPRATHDALSVFTDVEKACTRFDDASPLMQANARPSEWHRLPQVCVDALYEAWQAYRNTGGRFDPRVYADLVALGYDRSFSSIDRSGPATAGTAPHRRLAPALWQPRFRLAQRAVCLGGDRVDLGGIGKGLALRWASARLRLAAPDFAVNAGGDCYCAGSSPDGAPWSVGIEDPFGGAEPVAVVALSELAAATSSVRVRRWQAGGMPVHHLIDPRTGLPGGAGLVAVTVIGDDPADSEVWSKVLFLAGRRHVATEAERRGVAACWVTVDGDLEMNAAFEGVTLWRRA